LIPRMEAQGAAIATVITQSLTALFQLILVMRVFKFSIHWSSVSKLAIFIIIYVPTAFLLHQNFHQIWSLVATVGIGFSLLIPLKLLHFQDLLTLIKSKTDN